MTEHCGVPWLWTRSLTNWEGKPGQGYEITETTWACVSCAATLTTILREPA